MKDLSTVKNSMSDIIQTNHARLDSCTSVSELVSELKKLFGEYNLDTPASRRLILNVSRSKSIGSGLQTIWNSYLCGSNLSVIR